MFSYVINCFQKLNYHGEFMKINIKPAFGYVI